MLSSIWAYRARVSSHKTQVSLKDVNSILPVYSCQLKYLKFYWQGQLWQFIVHPFGLNRASFIINKLMRPVEEVKDSSRFTYMYVYLDNALLMMTRPEIIVCVVYLPLEYC